MKTVCPVGTTLYEPDACANGYTLVSGSGVVRLITMNGGPAHEWHVGGDSKMGFIHRARLESNGSLMILVGKTQERPGHLEQCDWDGRLTWDYTPEAGDPHHDFWPRDDGSVLLICKEPVPPEAASRITDEARRRLAVYGDVLIEVSYDKEVTWRWHQHDHLDINTCNPIPAGREWRGGPDNNTITDWTHTNTIQALPPNRWFDAGDARFRPGNVLISMRQLDYDTGAAPEQVVRRRRRPVPPGQRPYQYAAARHDPDRRPGNARGGVVLHRRLQRRHVRTA